MKQKFWLLIITLVLSSFVAACGGAAETPKAEAPKEEAPKEEAKAEATKEEAKAEATKEEAKAEPTKEEPKAETEANVEPATSAFLNKDFAGTKLKAFFGSAGNMDGTYNDLIKKFTAATGIEVEIVLAPDNATDNLTQQLQFLSAGSADLDIYQIDVIWPGILADHAVDLNEYIPKEEIAAHFPAIVQNNTVNGKLVGLPWFTDAGLLYYRKDLLEKYGYSAPPATWTELEEMSKKIQEGERAAGNDTFWGYVWQGNSYEGLTCDALEWQVTEGGGSIIEPDGTISVNNPAAAAAFNRAKGWIDTISPPGSTTYQEEDSRGVWQTGNAAFMRNWPYAFSLGNGADSPIKGLFDATPLPQGAGKRSAGTLGGWQLMVAKYSKNIDAAAMFVRFVASPEGQKYRAIQVSLLPTLPELYKDADVLKAQPFMGSLLGVFMSAVARPSTVTGDKYGEVSAAYFNAVHSILTGEAEAEDALQDLEDKLVDITGFTPGAPKEMPAATEPAKEESSTETAAAPATADFLNKDFAGTKLKAFFGSAGNMDGTYNDLIKQFTDATGVEVEIVIAPDNATDNLTQQLQFLSAGSADLDVYQIDVIWPGILADHAVDLNEYIPKEEVAAHFPAIVQNNTVNGKLVGLPWFTDAGLLYYRTDLLKKYGYSAPPATWTELEEMSKKIQEGERAAGNDTFWGYVWQGNSYEGLTCDALEWQVTEGGGSIIEPDGTISVNNPNTIAALNRAKGWVDTISPPGSTTYQEEDSRGVWQTGNAAFMRNWPYAFSLGNGADSPIKGQFDATPLPQGAGKRSAGTLGGWQLMVSKYSKNIDATVMFVRFMASAEGQKDRAIKVSLLPTLPALYKDADILKAQPFMGSLLGVFMSAVARPSTVTGDKYGEVSAAYFNAVHSVLTGEEVAEDALQDLEDKLVDITGFTPGAPK